MNTQQQIDLHTRELVKGMDGRERLGVIYGFSTMRPDHAARLMGLDDPEPPTAPASRPWPWWVRLLLWLRIATLKARP